MRDRGLRRVLPKFLQHRDIVTPAAILEGLHQDVCKAGDEGIFLKRPASSMRLSLQNFEEPSMWPVNRDPNKSSHFKPNFKFDLFEIDLACSMYLPSGSSRLDC